MDRQRVESLIDASSWEELLRWSTALSGEDLEQARRWYRGSLRARARKAAEFDWGGPARTIQVGLAATLAETPLEASQNCRWGRSFVWTDEGLALPQLSAMLTAQGREWAAEFITLACSVDLRGAETRRAAAEITALTMPVITANDLPLPSDATFVRGWAQLVSAAHVASPAANRESWTPARLSVLDGRDGPEPAYGNPWRPPSPAPP